MEAGVMYMRFMLCLAMGFMGLSMVLVRLLDTIFAEWDVVEDAKAAWYRPKRSEARLETTEGEGDKRLLVTRLARAGQGRENADEPYVPPPFPEEVSASAEAEPEPAAAR